MGLTTGRSSLGRVVLGVVSFSLLTFVRADFAECVPGWEWSYNSKGQNPCEIAGSLQAPCAGYSAYILPPLSNGTNYVTPQKTDTNGKNCGCNTIIYSLYSACTLCQFNYSATGNTWQFWSQFCDKVYVTQYPFSIPLNASVPHWAYLDDTTTFDPVLAKAAGRDPEATPTSPPTVSLSSTSTTSSLPANSGVVSTSGTRTESPPGTRTSPSSTSTSPSGTSTSPSGTSTSPSGTSASPPGTSMSPSGTSTSQNPYSTTSEGSGFNSGGTKTNTGVIAGGVVGGVVAIAVLAALAFFFLKRRRERGDSGAILGVNQMGHNTTKDRQVYEPPRLYDPSDPSTFPTPPSAGDSSNSGGYTTDQYQAGRYHGAAELCTT